MPDDRLCLSYRLNLATYVTTHMEKDVQSIIDKCININLADAVQYPSCLTMHNRWGSSLSSAHYNHSKQSDA